MDYKKIMSEKIYYINKEHTFPFRFKEETWVMYYPGYEGFYAISTEGNILSLERKIIKNDGKLFTVKRRKLKQLLKGSRTKRTLVTFNLYNETSNGKPLSVTINQILNILNNVQLK